MTELDSPSHFPHPSSDSTLVEGQGRWSTKPHRPSSERTLKIKSFRFSGSLGVERCITRDRQGAGVQGQSHVLDMATPGRRRRETQAPISALPLTGQVTPHEAILSASLSQCARSVYLVEAVVGTRWVTPGQMLSTTPNTGAQQPCLT